MGESVFFWGWSQSFQGGMLEHGSQGVIDGACDEYDDQVWVRFEEDVRKHITIDLLNREPPPPLPGGFVLGETLFYQGPLMYLMEFFGAAS